MHDTTDMIDSVRDLERTGMNREQAEALTKLLHASIVEAVQHLATKAEVAKLRQYMATHMATKAEVAELRQYMATHMATKTELAKLGAQVMAHTDAQIALLRGELTEKIGTGMKYMALSVGFSTAAIIAAIFAAIFAVFFATPPAV